jgi:hypothetical protein
MFISADGERETPVVGPHQLLEESFRCGNITFGAQHKFDCVPGGVDRAVEILPY